MNRLSSKRLIAEGFLIVFSVLFALFISQMVESNKTRKRTIQALEKIDLEIEQNNKAMDRWVEKHGRVKARLDSLVSGQNPDLMAEFRTHKFFDLDVLLKGESLIDVLINETAWKTAQSTEIISEFDYDVVEELTLIYGLQEIVMNQTLSKILDALFSRETQNLDNLEATLYQLDMLFYELKGQESVLSGLYKQRIKTKNN